MNAYCIYRRLQSVLLVVCGFVVIGGCACNGADLVERFEWDTTYYNTVMGPFWAERKVNEQWMEEGLGLRIMLSRLMDADFLKLQRAVVTLPDDVTYLVIVEREGLQEPYWAGAIAVTARGNETLAIGIWPFTDDYVAQELEAFRRHENLKEVDALLDAIDSHDVWSAKMGLYAPVVLPNHVTVWAVHLYRASDGATADFCVDESLLNNGGFFSEMMEDDEKLKEEDEEIYEASLPARVVISGMLKVTRVCREAGAK